MYRRKKSKKLVTPSKLQKCFDDVDDDAYSDSSRQGDDENVRPRLWILSSVIRSGSWSTITQNTRLDLTLQKNNEENPDDEVLTQSTEYMSQWSEFLADRSFILLGNMEFKCLFLPI